ncbi:MAG: sulfurtransferase TusA family protein [Candidatus Methanofastidiosa archaeon]|jgi:TusA-related sulfurtransferase|nr:sulfurtransferase TusA family protein [Candidatus Methanofastidiosa archaeon]
MADEVLDVTGLTCPGPLVESKKKIKRMEAGTTLEIRGTHAPSKKEVPEMLADQGHEILSVTQEGDVWVVTVRKA